MMRFQQLKILIVDDHEVIRRALRSLLLSRPEWTVCGEAAGGAEALEITRLQRPDVVLMDISMPDMNGVEVTRVLRRDYPDVRVLIVSQNDPQITRNQAELAGAAGYVAKADISRRLLTAIDEIVGPPDEPGTRTNPANQTAEDAADSTTPWLEGGGKMGELIRAKEWSETPLGRLEHWPESLKLSTSICVSSKFDLILWWGPDLIMLYNDSYRRTLGAKHPFALGQPGRVVYPEIWDVIGPMLKNVMRTGEATWSTDLLLLLERSGYPEESYHTFSYTPIRDAAGKIVGVITPVTETTEKVISERRLLTLRDLAARSVDAKNEKEAWEFAAHALGANPYDISSAVLYKVSEDSSKASAVARAGVGSDDSFFADEVQFTGEDEQLSLALRKAVKTGKPVELDERNGLRLSQPGGFWGVVPAEVIVLPIAQTGHEKAMGAMAVGVNRHKKLDEDYRGFLSLVSGQIARSIADARVLDQERQRAEALAELDRAKTAFFSNVSHELRTPLTLILGPIEDLLSRGETITACASEIELVHRNVLRLLKLVNTLLDFSRIEAGRTQAIYGPTELGPATAEIASVFRSVIEKAGLRYEVNCPDMDEPVYVDLQMWEKIVLNLISNAVKFTAEGKITVELRRVGDAVELTVSDTGTGIPKAQIGRIFERFHRVEGTLGRTHEGTGIGLALVQELVKLHGGTIAVQSECGGGSRFTVAIPLGKAHLPQERLGNVAGEQVRQQHRKMFENEAVGWMAGEFAEEARLVTDARHGRKELFRTARVLLAEDNADMADYIRRILQEEGYLVDVARDGAAALELAARRSYDLVLSDVMMPKVDGIELLRSLRNDPKAKTTPVVLLSARAGQEFRIQGLGEGADDYLVKPFSARELVSRVSAHIESRIRRQESEERLSMALELGRMGTWDLDLESGREYWSPMLYEMLGYRPGEDEASSEAWSDRVHPEDLPGVLEKWEEARKYGRDFRLEYRICLPSGVICWVETTARFFRDGSGKAYRLLGVSRDITGTKQTEEELRQRRHRLIKRVRGQKSALLRSSEEVARQAELLDLANDAAFVSNHENRITYWNRGAERLYGWRREEAIGKNAAELLQTEFPIPYREVLETMEQKGVWEGELQQTTRYGHRMTVASRWTSRRDSQGNPIGWLEINSDLTLQKQSQEAARRLSARILKVQDDERRKVARELHDSLGQYLASLKVNVSASLRTVESESSRQLLTECTQLLDQCLAETRTISYLLHPPLLDETGLASPIRWYVEGFAKRSGIEVALDMPESIPRFSNEIETAVFRILQESLTNAHRHAKTPKVDIGIQLGAETIVMSVRDYGSGIPPRLLRSFMERNERVGVGLAGMRERARELGGLMTVMRADDGPGTIVAVEIPIVRRESQRFGPTDPEQEARTASAS
jgi:PAS domain S-box-containing protein